MVRWYVTIHLASIKSKRIKLRIKQNHNIPKLNPQPICINIIILSGVYAIDSIQTKMVPVHFTIILRVRICRKQYFTKQQHYVCKVLNFSDLFCLIFWVVPGFSCAKSSGWIYQSPCFLVWWFTLIAVLYIHHWSTN